MSDINPLPPGTEEAPPVDSEASPVDSEASPDDSDDEALLAELARVDAEVMPAFEAARERSQLKAAREKRLLAQGQRSKTKRDNAPLDVDSLTKETLGRYLRTYREAPIEMFIRDVLLTRDGNGNLIHRRGFKQVIAKPMAQRFLRYMKYKYGILRLQERLDAKEGNKGDNENLKRLIKKADRLYQTLPLYLQWREPRTEYTYRNATVAFTKSIYDAMDKRRQTLGLKTMSSYIRDVVMADLGIEYTPNINETELDNLIEDTNNGPD